VKTVKKKKMSLKKIGAIDRQAVKVPNEGELVTTRPLRAEGGPLVVEPAVEGVDLASWASASGEKVRGWFEEHRAVLFRGFEITDVESFQAVVNATTEGELLEYRDRSTPRTTVGEGIYVSTIYPADQHIKLHNEGTYWRFFPGRIYFCALKTAEEGGETPIADVRKVLARLDPEVRERFREHGVLYVRNYNDGLGLPWQEVFQTESREEVEEYSRKNQIEVEWKEGGRMRSRQRRPAIRRHPESGEDVWFNHAAFFHVTSLEPSMRETLLADFGEEGLPYNTYYGDGSPIGAEVVAEIHAAYDAEKIVFSWQPGDILMLDNLCFAHGRRPYKGERQIVVAMSEPYSGTDGELSA